MSLTAALSGWHHMASTGVSRIRVEIPGTFVRPPQIPPGVRLDRKLTMDATEYDIADILRNATNPAADHTTVQRPLVGYNIAAIAVTTATVMVRIFVRALIVRHVMVEDLLMLAAGALAISLSTTVIIGTGFGLGRNVWDLPPATIIRDVRECIQALFICTCLHAATLTLVKLSVISTYWRIFPDKPVRWTLLVIATAITAVAIGTLVGTIFQCRPIAGAWDFNIERQCFHVEDLFFFSTAFSAFTDVVLCVLPLPSLWKLHIPRKEKIIASCLFCLGLFAAAASMARLTTLGRLRNINATKVTVPALNWSVAEVITGIVCASLPTLKPLLNKLLPGEFFTRRTTGVRAATLDVRLVRSIRPPPQALAPLSASGHSQERGDCRHEEAHLTALIARLEHAESREPV